MYKSIEEFFMDPKEVLKRREQEETAYAVGVVVMAVAPVVFCAIKLVRDEARFQISKRRMRKDLKNTIEV